MLVGRIRSLWRYPVSSSSGERLPASTVVETGLKGDRGQAFVHAETGEIATPERKKQWHPAPLVRTRLMSDGAVYVSLDGDCWLVAEGAEARSALAEHFGFPVVLRRYTGNGEKGEPKIEQRYRREPLHLLTTASLNTLSDLLPEAILSVSRFRPNLVLETQESVEGMVEQGWIGRCLAIGSVRLYVARPCGRCSFTTLQQLDAPLERSVLTKLIATQDRQFGVLCRVGTTGKIREGDDVHLLH